MEPVNDFILHLDKSLKNNEFIKLTLSKPPNKSATLRNIYGKVVNIKSGERVSLTFRYSNRDEVKNIGFDQLHLELQPLIGRDFLAANLMTMQGDYELLINKKGHARLLNKPASQQEMPLPQHDKMKDRLLDPQRPYWFQLGLTDRNGTILPSMQHKWKQINQYIDILQHHLEPLFAQGRLRVVDMGAGKGYLTFALFEFLLNNKGFKAEITGVEQRPDLVNQTNEIARKAELDGLQFVQGAINDYSMPKTDVLIALHACDTATDDAIAAGIKADAALIVCAPCCHKQIRKEISATVENQPILKFGIMMERQAEILTDTLRALIMEKHGYKSQIQEFIEAGHTPKNLLLTGIQSNKPVDKENIERKIRELKTQYGIKIHHLESLLISLE
jgi:SAM-dependent methyltransferase